jgi:hypothetical protein
MSRLSRTLHRLSTPSTQRSREAGQLNREFDKLQPQQKETFLGRMQPRQRDKFNELSDTVTAAHAQRLRGESFRSVGGQRSLGGILDGALVGAQAGLHEGERGDHGSVLTAVYMGVGLCAGGAASLLGGPLRDRELRDDGRAAKQQRLQMLDAVGFHGAQPAPPPQQPLSHPQGYGPPMPQGGPPPMPQGGPPPLQQSRPPQGPAPYGHVNGAPHWPNGQAEEYFAMSAADARRRR